MVAHERSATTISWAEQRHDRSFALGVRRSSGRGLVAAATELVATASKSVAVNVV